MPYGAIGVDLSIGDLDRLSEGLGTMVLRVFCKHLAAEGYVCIIIDPDLANKRVVRAYKKAGFRAIRELLGRSADNLIMKIDSESQFFQRP